MIFNLYLSGKSVLGIVKELERLGIKSPTGKWCKRTIDVMLDNEKYIGTVRLLNNGNNTAHYLSEDNNPAIISTEIFKVVQIEKEKRSNVSADENGTQRKGAKYSTKK